MRASSTSGGRSAWVLALFALFVAGAYLSSIVHASRWVMDADEAVHAVEALRLHDRLVQGEVGGFLEDTYFPERWQPPVNPHVRWYPFVHAWFVQPFFIFFGANDFSARLPSVVLLIGTGLCFFELARRLASDSPGASGLIAVLLLLAAPNVLTFSSQSLVASAGLFFSYLALLAYLWSLEGNHRIGRALPAGIALGIATLTKYDHGGFLALVLGLCELGRVRFSIPRFLRPGPDHGTPAVLLGAAFLMVAAWFAHPDKLEALGDSVRHPLPSSLARLVRNTASTLFVEYSSSAAVGLASIVAFFSLVRRLREPGLRAVWSWLFFATLFYVVRGRFYFRYNIVEGPGYLLLLAVVLPSWWRSAVAWLERAAEPRDLWRALGGWVASSSLVGVGLLAWVAPRYPFRWTSETSLSVTEDFLDVFRYLGASSVALGAGGVCFCVARLVMHGGGARRTSELLAALSFTLTALPGAVSLYRELPERVDWELEGHPEIGELCAFVGENMPDPSSVLLSGGWDQLTNNTLRWYMLTRGVEPRNFDDVQVTGDMIGSIVFPAEPRVAYWAKTLATAPIEELPATLVQVRRGKDFLYHTWIGNENQVYAPVLEMRNAYESIAWRSFETLGCAVEILGRRDEAAPLAGMPEMPDYVQFKIAPHGWAFTDEALRHFDVGRRDERRSR